jgi:hypothetical protein
MSVSALARPRIQITIIRAQRNERVVAGLDGAVGDAGLSIEEGLRDRLIRSGDTVRFDVLGCRSSEGHQRARRQLA